MSSWGTLTSSRRLALDTVSRRSLSRCRPSTQWSATRRTLGGRSLMISTPPIEVECRSWQSRPTLVSQNCWTSMSCSSYMPLTCSDPGGRVGFVTSNAWLNTKYGVALQLLLLRDTRVVAIIGSEAEPFFPQAAINTVVTIAEKPAHALSATDDYTLKFVSMKRSIAGIVADAGGDRWAALDALAGQVEGAVKPLEDSTLRIRLGSRAKEYQRLRAHMSVLPWNVPMRAPRLLLETLQTDYELSLIHI